MQATNPEHILSEESFEEEFEEVETSGTRSGKLQCKFLLKN